MLYSAGIIAQAGLSAHLRDVGFDDDWCAKHIRHNIEKALAYSNASGLGWERTEMQRLAETLSPYWKWNRVAIWHCGHLDDGGRAQPNHLVIRYARYSRSEEHTSELQSLMRISYAVFCLKKKINTNER